MSSLLQSYCDLLIYFDSFWKYVSNSLSNMHLIFYSYLLHYFVHRKISTIVLNTLKLSNGSKNYKNSHETSCVLYSLERIKMSTRGGWIVEPENHKLFRSCLMQVWRLRIFFRILREIRRIRENVRIFRPARERINR
jgi:hypothetical protein